MLLPSAGTGKVRFTNFERGRTSLCRTDTWRFVDSSDSFDSKFDSINIKHSVEKKLAQDEVACETAARACEARAFCRW